MRSIRSILVLAFPNVTIGQLSIDELSFRLVT